MKTSGDTWNRSEMNHHRSLKGHEFEIRCVKPTKSPATANAELDEIFMGRMQIRILVNIDD